MAKKHKGSKGNQNLPEKSGFKGGATAADATVCEGIDNGGGNGGGGISKKDLELLIEKASQTGPTQTIRIEQAPIKISTDDKPYTL